VMSVSGSEAPKRNGFSRPEGQGFNREPRNFDRPSRPRFDR
jgi:hypothetical protein